MPNTCQALSRCWKYSNEQSKTEIPVLMELIAYRLCVVAGFWKERHATLKQDNLKKVNKGTICHGVVGYR